MDSYVVRCDDADPEARCEYSAEGSSVDEVYQAYMKHVEALHSEKIKALSPEQLKAFDDKLRELVQSLK